MSKKSETKPTPVPAPAPTPAPTEPPAVTPAPAAENAPDPTPGDETPPADPATPPAEEDYLLSIIHRDLNPNAEPPAVEPAPEPVETPSTPPATPTAETPAPSRGSAPAAETPPAPAAKPAKKSFKSIAKGNPLVDAGPASAPAAVSPPAAPATPAPAPTSPVLTQDQQEELAEAEVAARLFPERKGYPDQLRQYYANFQNRVQSLMDKNPNVTEEDEEYQAILKTKPRLKDPELKKVLRTIAKDEAVADAEEKMAPRLKTIELSAKRAELLPGITTFVNTTFAQGIRQIIQNDDQSPLVPALKVLLEKGEATAAEEYPLEFGTMVQCVKRQQARIKEFLLLANDAAVFDAQNPIHNEIATFVNDQGNYKAKHGGSNQTQNGKQFLPRAEFIGLLNKDQAEAATFNRQNWQTQKYWTFTNTQIVDMMAIATKQEAENAIKFEIESAEKKGFQRASKKQVVNPQTPPAKPPTEIKPPRTTTTAAPGATNMQHPPAPDADDPIPVATIASSLKMKK